MRETKIKICGLFRPCDGDYVSEALPDYGGFVFYEGSRRFVTEEQALALRQAIHTSIETVGVFVNAPMEQIEGIYEKGLISIVQLHGDEDNAYIEELGRRLPKAKIWKAFQVHSAEQLQQAERCAADLVLLDNGAGTGVPFDWALLKEFQRDFILAGGLTAENIPQAIEATSPYGVDLSSGAEEDGVKSRERILAAVAAAKGGELHGHSAKAGGE
jgi:phosphoribosylanthranilate isomerase